MSADTARQLAEPSRAARLVARVDVLGAYSVLIALGLAAALLYPRLQDWGHALDEGSVLAHADIVREGAVPHRDFLTFYGPGNLWLVAGAFELFGTSVDTERAVGLLYRILISLALFALARRVAGNVAAVLAAVIPAALMAQGMVWADAAHGAIAFALVGLALAAWGVADGDDRHRDWILLAAGAVAGAAVLMRFDFAPAVIVCSIPLLLAVPWRSRLWFAGGFVALAGIYVPHLLIVGPARLERLVDDMLTSSRGRTLPLPSVWDHPGQLMLAAGVGTAVLLAVGAFLVWRERRPAIRGRLLIAVALFTTGLLPWMLSRPDEIHTEPVAMIPLSLLPAAGLHLAGSLGGVVRGVCTVAVISAVAVAVYSTADFTRPDLPAVNNGSRSFSSQPESTSFVSAVIQQLERDSSPGESLFVGPQDLRRTNYGATYVYFLLPKLEPASYYMELNPGTASGEDSGLADELRRADWLVLTSDWDDWKESNDSVKFGSSEPNQVVRDLFCRRLQAGTWRLYERCDRS